ncbi:protein-tyrosine-phosphatase [Christiangramia salexigens]|uniref:Protein-tyrosine-phosphatase n=1 Tax=Christiangramia salexigens TaxID=1913577 RepID=A0A1L3J1Y8_9FLAO|nr:protein-tyrosine-phosphatase [Christiangramia salexigens]APG59141.1 protein-tyrosine-phosphatase [Christiangramia salexigens]
MIRTNIHPPLYKKIGSLKLIEIPEVRKKILKPFIDYLKSKNTSEEVANLNFICTHNSRRSQLAQIWAKALSEVYGIKIKAYSGGTEVTAFHKNAIMALKRAGFNITEESGENPIYKISYASNSEPIEAYSKLYDAKENPNERFAAMMTCSHADENCPHIAGAESRIALDYNDPKLFDGTSQESTKYDERSDQIASEFIYVFENVK